MKQVGLRLYSTDNTAGKKNKATVNNRVISKTVTEVIETGTLLFNIDVRYKDGSTTTLKHIAFINTIPKLPPDPVDNQSATVGNKLIERTCKLIDKDLTRNVTKNIKAVSMAKKSSIGRRP